MNGSFSFLAGPKPWNPFGADMSINFFTLFAHACARSEIQLSDSSKKKKCKMKCSARSIQLRCNKKSGPHARTGWLKIIIFIFRSFYSCSIESDCRCEWWWWLHDWMIESITCAWNEAYKLSCSHSLNKNIPGRAERCRVKLICPTLEHKFLIYSALAAFLSFFFFLFSPLQRPTTTIHQVQS